VPEIRKDPIVGRSVIIAEARGARPDDFASQSFAEKSGDDHSRRACPFCIGNEEATPPAVFEQTAACGEWTIRVVPNRYPAVTLLEDSFAVDSALGAPDAVAPALGSHEVIVESPRHIQWVREMTESQWARVLRAWQSRIKHWRADGRFVAPLLFKNVGAAAGASIAHAHSQLIVLPKAPRSIAAEVEAARAFSATRDACIFCDLIERERSANRRIVFDEGPFVAFTAFAGRQPYETWLLPTTHAASFDVLANDELEKLAAILRWLIAQIETTRNLSSYNLILHTAPFDTPAKDRYHWHFELIPRSARFAGLELGGETHINTVAPEHAAAFFRARRSTPADGTERADSSD